MISVAVSGGGGIVAGIKIPSLYKLLVYYVISAGGHTRIITSYCNCAWLYSVEICHGSKKSVYTVSVAVPPV